VRLVATKEGGIEISAETQSGGGGGGLSGGAIGGIVAGVIVGILALLCESQAARVTQTHPLWSRQRWLLDEGCIGAETGSEVLLTSPPFQRCCADRSPLQLASCAPAL
jgi:hypothetical protein